MSPDTKRGEETVAGAFQLSAWHGAATAVHGPRPRRLSYGQP
jgi:hypothetical protein